MSTQVDLCESIFNVLDSTAAITTAFGHTGWLWQGLGPPGTPLPYATLVAVGGGVDQESGGWFEDREIQLGTFASDRKQARSLGRQAAAALEAATITYSESNHLYLRRDGPGIDQLDPEKGPNGEDVWQHILTFKAISGSP